MELADVIAPRQKAPAVTITENDTSARTFNAETYRHGALPQPVQKLRATREGRHVLREHGFQGKQANQHSDGMYPFVFWDGEGVTHEDRSHHYILFGCSTGASIQGPSLSTIDCLNLMLDTEKQHPFAIHVGFAFKYDVEMILFDVPEDIMTIMHTARSVRWRGFRLEYCPGKYFQVSRNKVVCRIWDVFGFFQASFVKTLRDLFGELPEFDEIESGKDTRNRFRYEDLESLIKPYWRSELEWGVKVVTRLRDLLYSAELRISHWHGPGAIANYLFKQHGIQHHKNNAIPEAVADAGQYAFTAGRFQAFKLGRANRKIYAYDINSAHPTGIAELPSLTGEWHRVTRVGQVSDVGLYRISFDAFDGDEPVYDLRLSWPQPFAHRDPNSLVSYPCQVNTWVWSHELHAIKRYGVPSGGLVIHDGWELEHDGSKPFAFVHDLYAKRKACKAAKDAVQIAYKLGLNSLFGKTAQRVGYDPKTGKIPRWHQLEWAGMITANTRGLLWDAIMQAGRKNALVSVDTDAVYSTEPLDLPCGDGLGEWEYEVWDDMVYLQNGIYWLLRDGEWKSKFRGLDPDSLTIDDALRWLDRQTLCVDNPYTLVAERVSGRDVGSERVILSPRLHAWRRELVIEGRTTRFVGSRAAFATTASRRCQWETTPRVVHVGTQGKMVHYRERCAACLRGDVYGNGTFHDLTTPTPAPLSGPDSYPHHVPWRELKGAQEWHEPEEILSM